MSCTEGVCRCSWEGALEGRGSEPISEGFSLTAATAWKLNSTRSSPGFCTAIHPQVASLGSQPHLHWEGLTGPPFCPNTWSLLLHLHQYEQFQALRYCETSQEISGNGHIWIERNLREGFLGISMKTGSSKAVIMGVILMYQPPCIIDINNI